MDCTTNQTCTATTRTTTEAGGDKLFAPCVPRACRGLAPPTPVVVRTCRDCESWAEGCQHPSWADAPGLAGALEAPCSEFASRPS